ncbi:MAG: hypothetical protein U0640_05005 [Phycisphaerales bacterium]
MGRRPRSGSLASLPMSQLHAEIRRRQRGVGSLIRRRDKIAAKLAQIEAKIRELGGSAGGGRVRPTNSMSLVEALHKTLAGKTMGVTEAAEAVRKNGYNTNAANFRTMVNQALIKHKNKFKKVERGQYTAA